MLDELLAQARLAEPLDRITLRDPIAGYGTAAIEPMTDWLADFRLAAFAIRVLQRIGEQPDARSEVVAVLGAVDRTELPPHLIGDLDRALASLGSTPSRERRRSPRASQASRAPGMAGVRGRGYWVMRTSPWERPFIWAEALDGRLRQGWSSENDQNLELIAATLRSGGSLSESQQEARRALRMLATWEGGIRLGDMVVAPNLPEYGRLSVFRVTGSYQWSPGPVRQFGERLGHVLPVDLLVGDIDRYAGEVSHALRSILRVQTRLYNITGYGGDVERLIGGDAGVDRRGEPWTETDYERLFGPFPPTGPRPSDAEVELLAAEFGRTADAISWQWSDGAAYCIGRSATTTSDALTTWLDRRGVCQ